MKLARRTAIFASFWNCSRAPNATSPGRTRSCGWKLNGEIIVLHVAPNHLPSNDSLLARLLIDADNELERLVNVHLVRVQSSGALRDIPVLVVHVEILFADVVRCPLPLNRRLVDPTDLHAIVTVAVHVLVRSLHQFAEERSAYCAGKSPARFTAALVAPSAEAPPVNRLALHGRNKDGLGKGENLSKY